MDKFLHKLGVLAAMLSAFLSASAYDFEVDGIRYDITDPEAKTVEVTSVDKVDYADEITVPASVSYNDEQYAVTSIGLRAFLYCSRLTSVTLPNSLTLIKSWAFMGCNALTSITWSNSLTRIASEAFSGCISLTTLTLPESLTTIEELAFAHCAGLTTITLPSSLTDISSIAFYNCNNLTSIEVNEDNQTYASIDGILYNKIYAMLICCPAKKSGNVIVPYFVTRIEAYAFRNCSNLTSITLPSSLTDIQFEVFYGCYNINAVTSLAVVPPECVTRTFETINMQKCTLYVPGESIEAYKKAPEWSNFYHVEDMAGIDAVEAAADGTAEVFNLTGAKVADSAENLPAGVYIIRQGSAARKIIVK